MLFFHLRLNVVFTSLFLSFIIHSSINLANLIVSACYSPYLA
uniref:Uncharacterized protein n=1 Tax=Rhizophora mucronata TaxID=61149 RepID=A0A2P2PAV3_RHIMU